MYITYNIYVPIFEYFCNSFNENIKRNDLVNVNNDHGKTCKSNMFKNIVQNQNNDSYK